MAQSNKKGQGAGAQKTGPSGEPTRGRPVQHQKGLSPRTSAARSSEPTQSTRVGPRLSEASATSRPKEPIGRCVQAQRCAVPANSVQRPGDKPSLPHRPPTMGVWAFGPPHRRSFTGPCSTVTTGQGLKSPVAKTAQEVSIVDSWRAHVRQRPVVPRRERQIEATGSNRPEQAEAPVSKEEEKKPHIPYKRRKEGDWVKVERGRGSRRVGEQAWASSAATRFVAATSEHCQRDNKPPTPAPPKAKPTGGPPPYGEQWSQDDLLRALRMSRPMVRPVIDQPRVQRRDLEEPRQSAEPSERPARRDYTNRRARRRDAARAAKQRRRTANVPPPPPISTSPRGADTESDWETVDSAPPGKPGPEREAPAQHGKLGRLAKGRTTRRRLPPWAPGVVIVPAVEDPEPASEDEEGDVLQMQELDTPACQSVIERLLEYLRRRAAGMRRTPDNKASVTRLARSQLMAWDPDCTMKIGSEIPKLVQSVWDDVCDQTDWVLSRAPWRDEENAEFNHVVVDEVPHPTDFGMFPREIRRVLTLARQTVWEPLMGSPWTTLTGFFFLLMFYHGLRGMALSVDRALMFPGAEAGFFEPRGYRACHLRPLHPNCSMFRVLVGRAPAVQPTWADHVNHWTNSTLVDLVEAFLRANADWVDYNEADRYLRVAIPWRLFWKTLDVVTSFPLVAFQLYAALMTYLLDNLPYSTLAKFFTPCDWMADVVGRDFADNSGLTAVCNVLISLPLVLLFMAPAALVFVYIYLRLFRCCSGLLETLWFLRLKIMALNLLLAYFVVCPLGKQPENCYHQAGDNPWQPWTYLEGWVLDPLRTYYEHYGIVYQNEIREFWMFIAQLLDGGMVWCTIFLGGVRMMYRRFMNPVTSVSAWTVMK